MSRAPCDEPPWPAETQQRDAAKGADTAEHLKEEHGNEEEPLLLFCEAVPHTAQEDLHAFL